MMNIPQKVTIGALGALLAAATAGLYLTSGSTSVSPSSKKTAGSGAVTPALNQHYLNVAHELAMQAATPEEQEAAKQALDAADHELDLEYAYALQVSAAQPVPQTPQILDIERRMAKIRDSLEARQAEVGQLESAAEKAKGARRDALEDQLKLSQAEVNLNKEALDDAKEDLVQAGGDSQSRLQALKDQHEAASNVADTFKFPPLPPALPSGSFIARWSSWKTIGQEAAQIERAQQEAYAAAADIARQRDALQTQVAGEQAQRKSMPGHALTPDQLAALLATPSPQPPAKRSAQREKNPALPAAEAVTGTTTRPATNPALALIQRISADQATLRILDARIRAMNGLGSAYTNWETLVAASGRSILHGIIAEGLWIVLMMILAFFVNRVIDRFFDRLSLERKQKTTLEAVVRMSVRLVIVVVVLLMVFGKPDQLSTVLGLAGAGLTVVLKDFIVSFLGWFVLMGRHGIRVGDWVEINGVRGEVIEISLLRTVLLETGNWTDIGQPTGRQVAFLNQYAVDGYYFNFSTSGQWLWDELQVLIPANQNPYPLVEKIRTIVEKETDEQAQLAEHEWQRVSRRYGMRSFSAHATVNVRPTDAGVIAVVRYITRADERTEARYRLNHEIVNLFHNGEQLVPAAVSLAGAGPEAPAKH